MVSLIMVEHQATKPEWLEQKSINIFVQFSFAKHPELPDVPPIGSFARTPTEDAALRLIFSSPRPAVRSARHPGFRRTLEHVASSLRRHHEGSRLHRIHHQSEV